VRTIKEDILSWSKDFLEIPNKHLNNFPVCPYAKKTRLDNHINIIEHNDSETFLDVVVKESNNFKGKISIVACSDLSLTADELADYVHALNIVFVPKDVYLMASHPEDFDEEIDFLQDTAWESHNDFLMVLIQSFDELEEASKSLKKINYYNNWNEDYFNGTVEKRQQYKRLRNENC
jgi:hypothetical protein|tara:strand:- start:240 stop:770 length:531 start_codon:yes stop_codon:yes gene_type:complete